ncbi:MAG: hypothetical protein A4S09_05545 [Proteobacteria bacterium SG_bin7]|nr:MAG: hypothetical protein A4S09_05545 [Proteobacteria bacterium SG_bin7]
MKLALNLIFSVVLLIYAGNAHGGPSSELNDIETRLRTEGELAPLPEAKPLLIDLAELIESRDFKDRISSSHVLQMMRDNLRASLFHLNLKFEIQSQDYPYEPPFREPFPFRPTVEAMDEAIRFLEIVGQVTSYRNDIQTKLEQSEFFKYLNVLFRTPIAQGPLKPLKKSEMIENTVDSYVIMQERLEKYGEVASFTEYSETAENIRKTLISEPYRHLRKTDKAFALALEHALNELETVRLSSGPSTRVQSSFVSPYPYRRTIQAIMIGSEVIDMRERLTYAESTNWHEVEASWQVGKDRKILPLYHFNRYKYQFAGLIANPEIVMWPFWGEASIEDIIRICAAPWGLTAESDKTERLDRHYNTPKDNKYHDANHARRLWGYIKRKLKKLGLTTRQQKISLYREHEAFIRNFLEQTKPNTDSDRENQIRKQMRIIFFETIHETALTADRESLLYDLLRTSAVRQPFEVQVQAKIKDLEKIRAFDGNLKSGANELGLMLGSPTTIRYFMDRAPGFLANVYNKLNWGFYDSALDLDENLAKPGYRTPKTLAEAATRIFQFLGHEPPPMKELLRQIHDRGGQPELWNYFSMKDAGIFTNSKLNALTIVTSREVHENWREQTTHSDRW